ncbi:MAG: DUF2852 domain-containing protein [Alphaproteobacteria bacterium]|nr:DUF2852 domain-containing protein [Alphaproteobacteria bacterium]
MQLMDMLRRAEAWLDAKGRPAWIVAMVLGFVLFWPVGLGLLGYMIWSGRMGCGRRHQHRHGHRHWAGRQSGTGNSAFDAYREETLRRLEEERDEFVGFLDRLRRAKDEAEFDQFMRERNKPRDRGEEQGGFAPEPRPQPAG